MDEKRDFMGMLNFYDKINRNSVVFIVPPKLPCVMHPNISIQNRLNWRSYSGELHKILLRPSFSHKIPIKRIIGFQRHQQRFDKSQIGELVTPGKYPHPLSFPKGGV